MDIDINMNPNILVSILNMKLRNNFSDLEDLCAYYDIDMVELKAKMLSEDHFYCDEKKQFLIK